MCCIVYQQPIVVYFDQHRNLAKSMKNTPNAGLNIQQPLWLSWQMYLAASKRDNRIIGVFLQRMHWGLIKDCNPIFSNCQPDWRVWISRTWNGLEEKIIWLQYYVRKTFNAQFNMTKNGLEYDRKKFTPANVNGRTWPKNHAEEH